MLRLSAGSLRGHCGWVHDDDAEGQFLEVVLELEATGQVRERRRSFLGHLNELVIGGALPFGLADGGDLVFGQKVADARIKAFV